jgi:hypothetical protein
MPAICRKSLVWLTLTYMPFYCGLQSYNKYDNKYDSYKPKYNEKGAKTTNSAASTATTGVSHPPGPVAPLLTAGSGVEVSCCQRLAYAA